jgi:hypothetical protein
MAKAFRERDQLVEQGKRAVGVTLARQQVGRGFKPDVVLVA